MTKTKLVKKGKKEQNLPDSCLQTVVENEDSKETIYIKKT